MSMLYIDTRESGNCHKNIAREVEHEYMALDAGDYIIPKKGGLVVIERSTYTDFAGKIMSGRLWQQLEKCTAITDDVYFILENPFSLKYTKMNLGSIYGAMLSLSRKCKIITTRSASETKIVILGLHTRFTTDKKVEASELRVKLKSKNTNELAKYCLMGITGVGSSRADKLLENRSIAELSQMSESELSTIVSSKLAKNIYSVLNVK